jgi:protein transport protein SEC13
MASNTKAEEPVQEVEFDAQHEENINDCQYNYYGTRVASADCSGFISISDNEGAQLCSFQAHNGPCWQVAWAHPKYESVLASCGYDGSVKVWKETQSNQYCLAYEQSLGESVNCISFGPMEHGLAVACGTASGKVCVLTRTKSEWVHQSFVAHKDAVNGISWAPFSQDSRRFATCGSDNFVRVWDWNDG